MRAVKINLPELNSRPLFSDPVSIGFGSVPGGTGCTTLACHFAVFLARSRQRQRTLAMSADRSGDLVRRLVGDVPLLLDTHWNHPDIGRLSVSFCPQETLTESDDWEKDRSEAKVDLLAYLPNFSLPVPPDIVVVDLGPGQTPSFDLDFWVIPVRDQRSIDSVREGTFPVGRFGTLFVSNGGDSWSPLHSEKLLGVVKECGSGLLLPTKVPNSGLLRRTAEERTHIWAVGEDDSCTRKRIERFCFDLLVHVKAEQNRRDLLLAQERATTAEK